MDSAPGLCAAGAAVGLCAAAAGVCAAGSSARSARAPPPVLPDDLVEAYLKRLGLESPIEPTLASLNELVFLVFAGIVFALGEGVDAVEAHFFGLGFVLGDFLWLGLDRGVDGVVPEIQKERPLVAFAN